MCLPEIISSLKKGKIEQGKRVRSAGIGGQIAILKRMANINSNALTKEVRFEHTL